VILKPAVANATRRHLVRAVLFAAAVVEVGVACRSDAPAAQARNADAPATPAAAPEAAAPADTQRVVLAVQGMYCTSCERTVSACSGASPACCGRT
jgi:hypothetical protein